MACPRKVTRAEAQRENTALMTAEQGDSTGMRFEGDSWVVDTAGCSAVVAGFDSGVVDSSAGTQAGRNEGAEMPGRTIEAMVCTSAEELGMNYGPERGLINDGLKRVSQSGGVDKTRE